MTAVILSLLALLAPAFAYNGNYYCRGGSDVVVHLFEWKWTDIARECQWLGANGYCAVQVSPPNEHRIVVGANGYKDYPWWQRYQPVSYKMTSRSGDEAQFRSMVETCNDNGVSIYVDAIINHMAGGGYGTGSAGSSWNGDNEDFPGVPYSSWDFHGRDVCFTSDLNIQNYNNPDEVRYCRLSGLRDLRGGKDYVRDKIAEYFNKVIDMGVAGFRVDAAKHMFPADIEAVLGRLNNLNTRWYPANTRPYVFVEVIDMGGEPIKNEQYTHLGRVTEFKYGKSLGDVIRKNFGQRLAYLKNFGEGWGFTNGMSALTFVDNHDNQRGHGAGGFGSILTFFEGKWYKMANAFMLAWSYGHVRIMSSYNWPRDIQGGQDRNDWIGPPTNGGGSTKDAECFNGEWICEHRWRQISNMVKFHNAVLGQPVSNWWDNGNQAISFGRGNKGYMVMNNEDYTLDQNFNTGLPDGEYCDVINCENNRPPCGTCESSRQTSINVSGGWAKIRVPNDENPMMAFHV